jgi:protocatechuate 3,4-dioxygenase beta subunit
MDARMAYFSLRIFDCDRVPPMIDFQKNSIYKQIISAFIILLLVAAVSENSHSGTCSPTPWDEIGPFYRPNAPERTSIGKGYILSGTVRSSGDCRPLRNARIEIWQAGPDGTYDDAHRATIFSNHAGRYRLQTSMPPPYARRPPHIHILVDAKGFEGLITQHYPKNGKKRATFDLVLEPEKQGEGKIRNPAGR